MPGSSESHTHRMIELEDDRLAQSIGSSVRLTRRTLLTRTAALAAAWTISPWAISAPTPFGRGIDPPSLTQTLEAFADTLIPGEKRFPADRAIAGVVSGAGAVQAGAIEMLNFPAVGFRPALPGLALTINVFALLYALEHRITLSLTVPPIVELDFAARTALLVKILGSNGPVQGAFNGLASVVFVAYHTAGYLPTAEAIRAGHPGLKAIGFPPPDPDGLWRFPQFSYRRVLAQPHPQSYRGNPA
jgi:hypothetical protein